jgi:hypothetical protein
MSTSVVNFPFFMGSLGIAPYIVSTLCLILKSILSPFQRKGTQKKKFLYHVIRFALFTICVSLFAPFFWEGSGVHIYLNSHPAAGIIFSDRRDMTFGIGQNPKPDFAYSIMWMYVFMGTALLPHEQADINHSSSRQ